MPTYKTPGVFIEEVPKFPPSVAEVETAIPAFIGFTENVTDALGTELTNKPVRITSLLEYEQLFGKPQSERFKVDINDIVTNSILTQRKLTVSAPEGNSNYNTYYQVQMFYANGGGPCYIVSAGGYSATFGEEIPGATGSALFDALESLKEADEPTLILFPDAMNIEAPADCYNLYDEALNQCELLKDRFVIIDVHGNDAGSLRDGTNGIGMKNLKYGAAYFPNLITSIPFQYTDENISISHKQTVDGAPPTNGSHEGEKLSALEGNDFSLYGQIKVELSNQRVTLAPSGAIAGIYAYVDRTRGVWKAPANVSVDAVNGLTVNITDEMQENLNVDATAGKSINAIRAFTGKGILVWGARTLAGNDSEWRYVPVRRFFNMVEESVKKATAQFVFEPNDANTWIKVRSMIENFLTVLWRQGALAGSKPDQAFYVAVGLNQTMTAQDILDGKMIIEIGMAAVRPAEFIILRFSHKMQEA